MSSSESDSRRAGVAREVDAGPVTPGSDEHKALFCRTLLDTFDPYEPERIAWPPLDVEARARLVTLPIWDMAVETEAWAGLRVRTFAATLRDPLLREAVELDAFEEMRHQRVLRSLAGCMGSRCATRRGATRRAIRSWHSCAPATPSASTRSSPSACSRPRGARASSRRPSWSASSR